MGTKTMPSACEGEDDGVDLISDLGDDLLLRIFGLLPDARDFAGLAALSRRWRDLSTRSPTLHLHPVYLTDTDDHETRKRFRASLKRFNAFVDAVLEQRICSIDTLKMDVLRWPGGARAGLWLRRAMELVVKSLDLHMCPPMRSRPGHKDCKVRLPRFTTAAEIKLNLNYATLWLPAAVEFNALTDLSLWHISLARGDGGRLGRLLSSPCCPRLRKLHLFTICGLEELQLHARALEILKLSQLDDLRRLDLDTPRLSSLDVGSSLLRREPSNFTIRAPALQQLQCTLMPYPYETTLYSFNFQLLQSCTVHRLVVGLYVPTKKMEATKGDNVMVDIPQLPHVTNLELDFRSPNNHIFGACVSSILARCSNLQHLSLGINKFYIRRCGEACCICGCVGSWKEDKISLDHLREVEFNGFSGQECHDMAHLLLLNSPALQRMTVVVEASGEISWDDSSDDESPPCKREIMETSVSTLPRPRGKWRARAPANEATSEYEWTPGP